MLSSAAPDPANPFGEDALAMAALIASRAGGASWEGIAGGIGITPEGAQAVVATFTQMIRAEVVSAGLCDEAEATELAAGSPVVGGDPDFFMAVIGAWLTGKPYAELDAAMDTEPGTVGGLLSFFVATIENDLRAHGCPIDPVAAMQRAYDVEQQRQRPN